MPWKPHVTVAAIAEDDGRFLLVEEQVDGRVVLNQPAGHLEDGESPVTAVMREALEETAWDFDPQSVVGIYLWREPFSGESFLRIAFAGVTPRHHPQRQLDTGILRAVWLTPDEIAARAADLRSPLVMRCIDDFRLGRRFPINLVQHVVGDVMPAAR